MGYDDDECFICYNGGFGNKDYRDEEWVCLKCLYETLEDPRSTEVSYLKGRDWDYTQCFICEKNGYCMEIALCKDHYTEYYSEDSDEPLIVTGNEFSEHTK